MTEQQETPEKTGPPSFMEVCDEIRGEWLSRANSEADLATKPMQKGATARSFPETAAAYGEWVSRRIELSTTIVASGRTLRKSWGQGRG
jgi:hypothetical protein